MKTTLLAICLMAVFVQSANAQTLASPNSLPLGHSSKLNGSRSTATFDHYVTTDAARWQQAKAVKAATTVAGGSAASSVTTDAQHPITTFRRWGTTFNEQDWRALCLLTREQQDEILSRAFSPDGELRLSLGRISMNANDYALQWYSCSDVDGDFDNKHFNIERDKLTIIPYIHAAQRYNPQISFWVSPWSPPAWMKINHHYAVQSSPYSDLDPKRDYLLFRDDDRSRNEQVNPDRNLFPRRLAAQDFFIQDPRYLQCYADQFCLFIDLYKEQGVDINMVMYQNEAYSYTPYPGCPWTAEGIIRFNMEYLGPTLKRKHPEVELCLGTFNTNRYDHVSELLSDPRMEQYIKGIGFQWEGGQILARIRKEHPNYRYIQSESECGNGSMDWGAAEHTFHLINHYIGNGCSEYNNWNLILCDRGQSAWGWQQNALVRVNSRDNSYDYVPEWFSYRHYSQFIQEGARIIGFKPTDNDRTPVLVALTPQQKYVVVAGNFNDEERTVSIDLSNKTLTCTLAPHSMNSYVQK